MKTIAEIRLENLEILLHEAGSVKKLSEKSNITTVYISQLKHGALNTGTGNIKNIGNAAARKFEAGMGKPVGWMDTPHNGSNLPISKEVSRSTTVLLPFQDGGQPIEGYITFELLDIQAAAGKGGDADKFSEIIRQLHVLESWARAKFGNKIDRIHVITARGTSMQPTIDDGDILFIDATIHQYDGDGIYVLSREHSTQIKRLQLRYNGNLYIISDNPSYRTEELSQKEAETIIINGRVMAIWVFKSV